MPRNLERERIIGGITSDFFMFVPGTPVICQGLRELQHLNGKVGEIQHRDKGTDTYMINFEDANLKPRVLHPSNIRVIFDLPAVE